MFFLFRNIEKRHVFAFLIFLFIIACLINIFYIFYFLEKLSALKSIFYVDFFIFDEECNFFDLEI